ncbi:hypothetical protein IAU59_007570 [Kwoniella sp. CBS 9459]
MLKDSNREKSQNQHNKENVPPFTHPKTTAVPPASSQSLAPKELKVKSRILAPCLPRSINLEHKTQPSASLQGNDKNASLDGNISREVRAAPPIRSSTSAAPKRVAKQPELMNIRDRPSQAASRPIEVVVSECNTLRQAQEVIQKLSAIKPEASGSLPGRSKAAKTSETLSHPSEVVESGEEEMTGAATKSETDLITFVDKMRVLASKLVSLAMTCRDVVYACQNAGIGSDDRRLIIMDQTTRNLPKTIEVSLNMLKRHAERIHSEHHSSSLSTLDLYSMVNGYRLFNLQESVLSEEFKAIKFILEDQSNRMTPVVQALVEKFGTDASKTDLCNELRSIELRIRNDRMAWDVIIECIDQQGRIIRELATALMEQQKDSHREKSAMIAKNEGLAFRLEKEKSKWKQWAREATGGSDIRTGNAGHSQSNDHSHSNTSRVEEMMDTSVIEDYHLAQHELDDEDRYLKIAGELEVPTKWGI